jgi:hypothetical protein
MIARSPIVPSICITAWFNAARKDGVTKTDAANACETLANCLTVSTDSGESSWPTLIEQACNSAVPLTVVLPVPGDPCGASPTAIRSLASEFGVIALSDGVILGSDSAGSLQLLQQAHAIPQPDMNLLRGELQRVVQVAADQLSVADLVGDREAIDDQLTKFSLEHLPPTISHIAVDELQTAAKLILVAQHAVDNSLALHSPSVDDLRIKLLNEVRRAAEKVMCGLVSR